MSERCRLNAQKAPSLALAICVTTALSTAAAAQCEYEVAIIRGPECPPFGYPSPAFGYGLNSYGHVVGSYWQCEEPAYDEAFLWTPETGMITLERPEGMLSAAASDINDHGVIVGTCEISGLGFRGFVYDHGAWTILHPVNPCSGWSFGVAINNQSVVVGDRSVGDGVSPRNAFTWSAASGFSDLGLMGLGFSRSSGITESGAVVGQAGGITSGNAFIWQAGNLDLLEHVPGGLSSTAGGVNETLQIAGGGYFESEAARDLLFRPFLWRNGSWIALAALEHFDECTAVEINNVGQIVGECRSVENPNTTRAVLWSDGEIHDLQLLIANRVALLLDRGRGINARGQLVANGTEFGNLVSVLLTPAARPAGDLDIDCDVDEHDLQILIDAWGPSSSEADLNLDGVVNVWDLLLLLSNWG